MSDLRFDLVWSRYSDMEQQTIPRLTPFRVALEIRSLLREYDSIRIWSLIRSEKKD